MFQAGFAQEIITPPVGVGLAGYMNKRPNRGAYDDLYVKVFAMEINGTKFGLVSFDLCKLTKEILERLETALTRSFGEELFSHLILCATHTHTGPRLRGELDEATKYALDQVVSAAVRAVDRAFRNLMPSQLEVASVYNNPYGFVRRYWMKDGSIVTNPGWRNPNIEKPEYEFDRTIGILAIRQEGRLAGLICNIANHGDTTGGDIVSADWFGHLTHQLQHELKCGLPVMVIDDASGEINHFDFRQKFNQTCPAEAVRIGRGYAAIILDALKDLKPVDTSSIKIKNGIVTIPHRKVTDSELAEAKHVLATVPDIPKEGDFESQDLANKVPAALRYFAQQTIDCYEKSTPSHDCRLTAFEIGKDVVILSLPGEPFNGIAQAIRSRSPFKYTFFAALAQSVSGYIPLKECFARGGYEVQPEVNSVAPEAADILIEAALKNM